MPIPEAEAVAAPQSYDFCSCSIDSLMQNNSMQSKEHSTSIQFGKAFNLYPGIHSEADTTFPFDNG